MTGYRSMPKFGSVPISDSGNDALSGLKLWVIMCSVAKPNPLY
ncbi:hypothetical protein PTRA_a1934 [Pseudoalteromonas translucida KMM 520]|uniref:Uncharacterized protein n=1 Tax=Pseudoalteromonas translucida KMM 520 TaxID=1315283 RepID=A0A0U2X2S0_9GAMM|nr:hypothetical protein PTRA_a1934 [Pseudoalteromonas translucida KMM 520]